MPEASPSLLRRVLSLPVEFVVAIYVVLDGLVAPLFRPVMRALSRLAIIRRLEALIAALPPYLILVLLVVPFGIAEIAKAYAVLTMAEGHFKTGVIVFVAAYVVSILVCERIFNAGKAQLMTISWFKTAFDWAMALKDRVLGWVRRTRAWRLATDLRQRARIALRRMRTRLRSLVPAKPHGLFQRR